MSPWTDIDTAVDTGAARRAAARTVRAASHRILTEIGALLDTGAELDQVLAGLRRMLDEEERPTLPRSWHLDEGHQPLVLDHTCGLWPSVCADRWHLDTPTTRLHYTCTRIANHTGRHAAGLNGVVVAVWEQTVPEVLGAVEGAS